MNLKPFDLEKALAGAPVVTRDGRSVKIAGYNPEAFESNAIVGWVNGSVCYWYNDGTWCKDEERQSDLFMAPTERKEWVVRRPDGTYLTDPFKNIGEAER